MSLVTLAQIREAHARVAPHVLRTPLLPLKFGPEGVRVKCECLQRAGSFKCRGAFNKILSTPPDRRARGVVAYSSGNHAQAVALAAQSLGIPATIVMLDQSVPHKVAGTRGYGAEVIFGGRSSEIIRERAEAVAAERGRTLVRPFDDPAIIAGQGTVGLEILEDFDGVGTVVVPIGGGGLMSGIATAVKESRPGVRVIGVEPEGAPSMTRAIEAGAVVTLPSTDTIADGLKPVRVGELTFAHVSRYVDDIVLVTDAEILEATRALILREKLVVEPSGAASLAAIMSGRIPASEGGVVAVLSGGNADLGVILA